MNESQKAFEEWANKSGHSLTKIDHGSFTGFYKFQDTQAAWYSWQAGIEYQKDKQAEADAGASM